MDEGLGQMRLAITVFDHAVSLCSTVSALLHYGTSLEQLCLVALEDTMQHLKRLAKNPEAEWSSLSALTDQVVVWPGAPMGVSVVATSSPLVAALKYVFDGQNAAKSHAHAATEDGSHFSELIARGAIALAVGSAKPAQQAGSTRILLAQSTHGVSTYEFSLPKSSEV